MKITTEDIINRFKKVHGNRYDYSQVEYTSAKNKVSVICKIHGPFLVTPNNHENGNGCAKCVGKGFSKQEKYDNFVKNARTIHGDKYDYSLFGTITSQNKLPIICPIHGIFHQLLRAHITNKSGCPECGNIKSAKSQLLSVDTFIEKAKKVHGNLYDYSKVEYTGAHRKVSIICNEHGSFEVTPANHWSNKVGCPNCAKKSKSKGEQLIQNWLELNKIDFECQKTFTDLYYKSVNAKLKYDFYLPRYNILIEFDGEYHYSPISYSSNISPEDQLAITQIRDKIKTEYAASNNYDLLRIRFDDDIILLLEQKIRPKQRAWA